MRLVLLILCGVFALSNQSFAETTSYEVWKEQRAKMFKSYDLNSDGFWTLEEYMQSLDLVIASERLSVDEIERTKAEAKKYVFDAMDIDESGAVTPDEFSSDAVFEEYLKIKAEQSQ